MGEALMLTRRGLIAGTGGLLVASRAGALAPPPPPPPPPPPATTTVRLTVSPARSTDLTIWRPVQGPVRGVALLSTGHGSWPERYAALATLLTAQGYAVLAPLHVDSVRHPDRARFTLEASFGERLADMAATAGHARANFAKRPVVAVGHSFGTLTALCLAGGLPYAGAVRDPAVRAVLGFSSPGRIPGLVRPDAYSTVTAPLFLVTGTADTVPGFVTDPADHLFPVQTVRGPAFGLVVDGANHEFVAQNSPGPWAYSSRIADFLTGYAAADAAARRRLIGWKPTGGDRLIIRNAA